MPRRLVYPAMLLFLWVAVFPAAAADLYGVKPMGMAGAYRAVADDTGAIIYNPAGMPQKKTYVFDSTYYSDVRAENWFDISAIDTVTAPVAAGISYQFRETREKYGGETMHFGHLSLAESSGNNFYFGISGKYLGLSWDEEVTPEEGEDSETQTVNKSENLITVDLGILWRLGQYLTLGGVGYNLTNPDKEILPVQGALGLAVYPINNIIIAGDVLWEEARDSEGDDDSETDENFMASLDYCAGVDIMIFKNFYLRGGYAWEQNPEVEFFGAGVSWLAPRISFNFGMQKDTKGLGIEKYAFSVGIIFR